MKRVNGLHRLLKQKEHSPLLKGELPQQIDVVEQLGDKRKGKQTQAPTAPKKRKATQGKENSAPVTSKRRKATTGTVRVLLFACYCV